MPKTRVRRERNYTDFPRNTKLQHLRNCADSTKREKQVAAEVEACYREWKPAQVHGAEAMIDAFALGGAIEFGFVEVKTCAELCADIRAEHQRRAINIRQLLSEGQS
jgi:hypothetical protein